MDHIFVDGLGSLSVSSGIVRIEMCVQTKKPKRDKKTDEASATVLAPACSINMPIQGFANMLEQLQGLADKMKKDGILKKSQPASKPGSPTVH